MILRQQARQMIQAGINAVKPEKLIREHLFLEGEQLHIRDLSLDLSQFANIYVIGAGKASAFMGQALESILRERLRKGFIVVKYGHTAPTSTIELAEAGHPLPDPNTLTATQKISQIAREATARDLVLCLISGGGSALMELLPEGISLTDLQQATDCLLGCGAPIEAFNVIRKHISNIKGGKLAAMVSPATCISLIISDVIGDPLSSIASGPTAPDTSTFADAWEIIEKYHLADQMPAAIIQHLRDGLQNKNAETLKFGDPVFEKVQNIILGNNLLALKALEKTAETAGFKPLILSSRIQGEAREAAQVIAGIAREVRLSGHPLSPPACLIFGGETTVTLRGNGKGGRNQEFALAALLAMQEVQWPYLIMSCGTDGTDGPTDAAGAIADPHVREHARKQQLSLRAYLENNDAYHFFEKADGLLKTGPTGTNVMDIGIALIAP